MVDRQELHRAAINDALTDSDLLAAADAIATATDTRALLKKALIEHSWDFESTFTTELDQLDAADAELSAARQKTVDLLFAASGPDAEERSALLATIADQRAEQARLTEAERILRAAIEEGRATRAEHDPATAPNPPDKPDRTRRWRRTNERGADQHDATDDNAADQAQLAELQSIKKAIADQVTDRKRAEMRLNNLEREVGRRATAEISSAAGLDAAEAQFSVARARVIRAFTEGPVLTFARQWVNARGEALRNERYRLDLSDATASGLAEIADPAYLIKTRAQDRLKLLLEAMPGGTIGISGPRGAGKSTVLRAMCAPDARYRGGGTQIAVLVSAPVRFAPLDFVLHLFEQVCRAVLPPGEDLDRVGPVDPIPHSSDPTPSRALHIGATVGAALAAGVLVASGVLLVSGLAASGLSPLTQQLLALGALVVLGSSTWLLTPSPGVVDAAPHPDPDDATALGRYSEPFPSRTRIDGLDAPHPDSRQPAFPVTEPILAATWALLGGMAAGLGASVLIVASDVGSWDVAPYLATGAASIGGYRLTWMLARRAVGSALPLLLAAAVAVAGVLCVAAFTERPTSPTLTVGVLLLAVATAASLLSPRLARHVQQSVEDRGPGFRDEVMHVVGPSITTVIPRLALVLGLLALALVGLGWFGRTPNSSVVLGVAGVALGIVLWLAATSAGAAATRTFGEPQGQELSREPPEFPYRDPVFPYHDPDRDGRDTAVQELTRLRTLARARLERIRYQREFSADRSAKLAISTPLKIPVSAETSTARGRSATEQLMTLPEAVAALRGFLGDAGELSGRVLIGIDELDKIASREDADLFLNEIKAIVGIPRCFFLLTVSEDAIASFERRGLPLRDALDSAFDDIIRVEPFRLADSEALLNGRTLRMPLAFIALCHCLAGGLPRDVIRVARHVFELADAGHGTLRSLTATLLARDLRSKLEGTTIALGQLDHETGTSSLMTWIGRLPSVKPSMDAFNNAMLSWPEDEMSRCAPAVQRIGAEISAYWFFIAVVDSFFGNEPTAEQLELAETAVTPNGIDQLARARARFGVDPVLAREYASTFHEAWSGGDEPQPPGPS